MSYAEGEAMRRCRNTTSIQYQHAASLGPPSRLPSYSTLPSLSATPLISFPRLWLHRLLQIHIAFSLLSRK